MITQIKDNIAKIFKKNFIIGLDIGASSIKIAQFRKLEDGLHLIKTDSKKNSEKNEIVSVIKDLLKEINIRKSKFIVSINCPKTATTKVTAPYMSRQELADGVRLEAGNYFSFPMEDAELDFEVVDETVEKGVKKYQVIVATSSRKTINEYLFLLGKVGIKPAALVPVSYALQKIAEVALPQEDLTNCMMDIGSHYTELTIVNGKNLIFSRKIPVAGKDFTDAMTVVLASDRGKTELTLTEAEGIKCQIGIPPKGESKIVGDKISTAQISSMFVSPLERMVSEVDRCFDYYREETAGGKIGALMLFGAGAYLKGLPEFISERLGIEVKVGNPLKGLKIEANAISQKDESFCQTAIAIGAGLSEAKGINLLPVKIKKETLRTFKRSGLEAIVVGTVIVLLLIYIGIKIQLSNFQKNISVVKKELSSLEPELKQVVIFGLLAKEPYWDDVFKELSNIVPFGIYLTELNMEDNIIRMRGIVNTSSPEESLSNFILKLEKGLFSSVKLITTNKIAGEAANKFEITCWIDGA